MMLLYSSLLLITVLLTNPMGSITPWHQAAKAEMSAEKLSA